MSKYFKTIIFLMFMNMIAVIFAILYHCEQKKKSSKIWKKKNQLFFFLRI